MNLLNMYKHYKMNEMEMKSVTSDFNQKVVDQTLDKTFKTCSMDARKLSCH